LGGLALQLIHLTVIPAVGTTTNTFILFENGVRRNLSLSETLSGWRLTEAMLLFNEGSFGFRE
jgi:hypothetical protein